MYGIGHLLYIFYVDSASAVGGGYRLCFSGGLSRGGYRLCLRSEPDRSSIEMWVNQGDEDGKGTRCGCHNAQRSPPHNAFCPQVGRGVRGVPVSDLGVRGQWGGVKVI